MLLHTPGLISQISETVNEINAKKIIIIFKTPDYPVLVFSPHTSTQNMQIYNAHRNYYNGKKIVFYKLNWEGGGGEPTFNAPKYAALVKVYFFLKQEVNLNQGHTNHEIPVARQKTVYSSA